MTWFMIMFQGNGPKVDFVHHLPVLWGLFSIKKKAAIAGFYTTRYVEAVDADTAIDLASSLVRRELAKALFDGGFWNGLKLEVNIVQTVEPRDANPNAKGFSFFSEAN